MTILAIMFPLVVTSKFILSEKAGSLPLIIFLLCLFMEREQESRAKANLFCWLILPTMSHVETDVQRKLPVRLLSPLLFTETLGHTPLIYSVNT